MNYKNILLSAAFLMAAHTIALAQNVNIPDANFKAALLAIPAINTNADAQIQVSEAAAFTGSMDVSSKSIASLVGIEAFTALTTLVCYSNQLTTLDVSTNTALTDLRCHFNPLTALDVSINTALTTLWCSGNQLTTLDVSANTALTTLYCNNNQLTTLDVSTNTALTSLNCFYNPLTTLDVSANTALTSLNCFYNQLTTLDVSANTALTYLNCSNNQLTTLDVSANAALTTLDFRDNQLTALDVSTNTALIGLACQRNQLTALDVSTNTALVNLWCYNNQLTTLNVKNGNNNNMGNGSFRAESNPNLTCIEVDNAAYSTTNWTTNIDTTASFSTNCFSSTTTLASENININAYPNPTNGNLNISLERTYQTAFVQVRNAIGQTVLSNTYNAVNQIDINLEAAAGVYFVSIRTEQGEAIIKVIKE